MEAIGAEPVEFSAKTRCCGGSLTGTIEEVGLRLNYILLKEAKKKGADVLRKPKKRGPTLLLLSVLSVNLIWKLLRTEL